MSDRCAQRVVAFPGMTATHSAQVSARANRSSEHVGDRQTFELYGHRITHTGLRDGSQVKIGNTTMTVRVIEEG